MHGCYGTRCLGAMVRGAMVPLYHGARCLVGIVHGAMEHDAMVCDALVTSCLGAMVRVSMVPCRISLVRTSSELSIRRVGKAPEGTIPSLSLGQPVKTHFLWGIRSSIPPTTDGFETETPVPSEPILFPNL
ncbi:hypothetical protein T459_04142 [Capsicum annuum]|uniref:Uncharacterized protein n=1 Tax=Capsicum annuum TaxID=4072 RepID=A0A2G3A460_CAPAN|nr:hypothetical protein T459_04142 [Capsicum annuum]